MGTLCIKATIQNLVPHVPISEFLLEKKRLGQKKLLENNGRNGLTLCLTEKN